MVSIKPQSGFGMSLTGELSLSTVPAYVPYSEVLEAEATQLFSGKNMVVLTAKDALVQILRGNTADFAPAFISIGAGGDFNQDTKLDTGARVGPKETDTSLRQVLYRIPIVSTEDGASSSSWSFVAVARPHEAITPILNEFGLESRNGTMLSHYVTAAADSGMATQYCKTSLEYLIVKWTYTLELFINGVPTVPDPDGVYYLSTQDFEGNTSLTIEAQILAGSNTELALPVLTETGSAGTLDVQSDKTVNATTSTGGEAEIPLEERE